MPVKLCTNGKEVGLREAVDYLERQYGIPSSHMRMVSVTGEVGAPIAITVVVFMQDEKPAPLRGNVQPLDAGEHGEMPEGWMPESQRPEREPDERPSCLDHGAGCSGWPEHKGWEPSELDA